MPRLETLKKNLDTAVKSYGEVEGRKTFVNEIKESLGLLERDEKGNLTESFDENGNRTLAEGSWKPEEYSLRDIAEALGGQAYLNYIDPRNDNDPVALLMEAGPGVHPSVFANTNLWLGTSVAGLVDAKVMERFENAAKIGDQLFDTMPTNKNGEKMPGVSGFSSEDGDTTRKPGQPHPRASIGERWVTTPELVEKAQAIEVTQEAVFYDLTNQVLSYAGEVGEILAYGKEKTQCDLFIGATNSYNYKGVAYNTYQSSTPWINTQTNVAEDDSDLDAALDLFLGMTNPETNREIIVQPDTVVYYEGKSGAWNRILHGTQQRTTTNTNTQILSQMPPRTRKGYNEVEFNQVWHNRIVSELSESSADAKEYWFIGQPKKCFKWMEAWPLRVKQASPSEYAMVDRGLVAAYFANYRGVGAIMEPRYIVRNIQAS